MATQSPCARIGTVTRGSGGHQERDRRDRRWHRLAGTMARFAGTMTGRLLDHGSRLSPGRQPISVFMSARCWSRHARRRPAQMSLRVFRLLRRRPHARRPAASISPSRRCARSAWRGRYPALIAAPGLCHRPAARHRKRGHGVMPAWAGRNQFSSILPENRLVAPSSTATR